MCPRATAVAIACAAALLQAAVSGGERPASAPQPPPSSQQPQAPQPPPADPATPGERTPPVPDTRKTPDKTPDTPTQSAREQGGAPPLVTNAYASTYKPLPSRTTVIRGATILTAAGPVIERGAILLQNGKVAAVGQNITAPADAVVIEAAGRWVTPGIIDTHSHLGVYPAPGVEAVQDGNEMTGPNTAEVSAEHSLWPQDPQFDLALAGGVTAMQLLPGSANLFGGRGVTVKNVPSRTAEGMKFPDAPYGLKMACGENPKRVYGTRNSAPQTRMGNVAGYRRAWQAARDYRDRMRRWSDSGADPEKRPDRNLQLETLAGVLDGEILVHNHCYRADEMAIMINLAREFGYRIASFHHAVEAYKVRDLLAENGICASMWADWWGFKLEAYDGIRENVALVDQARGCAIVHSDDPNGIQRLNQEAAKALRAGWEAGFRIDRADAVKWLTLNPARALGIEKVTGSLEPGKNADVVIWSADPFSVYSRADQVFVDGALLYDRNDPSRQPTRDFITGVLPPQPPPTSVTTGRTRPSPPAGPGPELASGRTRAGPARQSRSTSGTVAITNARILPVVGAPIERGTLVIRDGSILAVGRTVQPPAGARVIDGTGKIVTPGWIDSATQIGIVEIPLAAEGTADQGTTDADLSAAFNVIDAFNGESTVIPVTRVEGITRAVVMPARTEHVLLGQGALVDLSGGQAPASILSAPVAMFARLGEAGAAAQGGSRASAMLRLREALQDALDLTRNRLAWNTAQRRPYARGRLDLEALGPVVRGELPLAVQANRASDLLAALRLADEFSLKLILMGAAEGWKVADEIAARKVPVVVKPLTNIPSFDALGATLENAARLSKAGVVVALSSFETHNARNLRQEAGNAVANGMDRDAALEAVTLGPARVWGIADRYGSLEVGKDADVVVWSGDPFELTTAAEHVFIVGREMSKDTRQRQLLERYRTIR